MATNSSDRFAGVRTGVHKTYRVSRAVADLAVTADRTRQQQGVGVFRGGSDTAMKYRNLKTELGWQVSPLEERAFLLAGDVFTVSGGVLSAIALPALGKKSATSFTELQALIHDPTATANARLDKVEELARSSGGTIFAAQGVVAGTKGTIGILSRAEGVATVVSRVSDPSTKFMRFFGTPFGKVLNVLLPVADAAVLAGEVIATRRAFSDPTNTASNRARKVLDLSLATLKTSFWLFPQARLLRSAYDLASFGQLALTLRDYWPQIQPYAAKTSQAFAWGIANPIQAVGAIVTGTVTGFGWVAQKLGSAVAWTADKALHPGRTWNNTWNEVSAWMRAYYDGKAQQVGGIFNRYGVPGLPGQAPAMVAAAPGAPGYAPAAPAYAPAVPGYAPAIPQAAIPAVAPIQVASLPPAPVPAPPPPAPAPAPPPAPALAPAPLLAAVPSPLPAAVPAPGAIAAADASDPLAQIRASAQAAANA
jgi:hypothetical protein